MYFICSAVYPYSRNLDYYYTVSCMKCACIILLQLLSQLINVFISGGLMKVNNSFGAVRHHFELIVDLVGYIVGVVFS